MIKQPFLQEFSNVLSQKFEAPYIAFTSPNTEINLSDCQGSCEIYYTQDGVRQHETIDDISIAEPFTIDANTMIVLVGNVTYFFDDDVFTINKFIINSEAINEFLYIYGNEEYNIRKIDLSKCINLKNLYFYFLTKLSSIDTSNLVNLETFSIQHNSLITKLDLSKNTKLTYISIELLTGVTDNEANATYFAQHLPIAFGNDKKIFISQTAVYKSIISTAAQAKGWTVVEQE